MGRFYAGNSFGLPTMTVSSAAAQAVAHADATQSTAQQTAAQAQAMQSAAAAAAHNATQARSAATLMPTPAAHADAAAAQAVAAQHQSMAAQATAAANAAANAARTAAASAAVALQTPPAAVPRGSDPTTPGGVATGVVVPAPPAGFAPYKVRPEVIGAPVQKQFIPPYFDKQTAASFAPPTPAYPIVTSVSPAYPTVAPVKVPPLVKKPNAPQGTSADANRTFNTVAMQKAAIASQAQDAAAQAARAAQMSQKAAAAAEYAANKTKAAATMHPASTPEHEVVAATVKANQARTKSQVDATTAAVAAALADKAAQDAANTTPADPVSGDGGDIWGGDGSHWDAGISLPPEFVPPALVPTSVGAPASSGVSPITAAAGAGAVGFLLGGPIGALIAAVAGGGYAYHRANVAAAAAAPTGPIWLDNNPVDPNAPLPPDVSWQPGQPLPGVDPVVSWGPQAQPGMVNGLGNVVSGGAAAMAALRGYRSW